MDVGVQMIFAASGWDSISDSEVHGQEVAQALLAEELGFSAIWPVEHRFFATRSAPTTHNSCPTSQGGPSASAWGRARSSCPGTTRCGSPRRSRCSTSSPVGARSARPTRSSNASASATNCSAPSSSTPVFRYGGLDPSVSERSMRLFASEVLPELATWD